MFVWMYSEGEHAPLGVLENFFAFRRVMRYDQHGEIEIKVPARGADSLRPGTVIWGGGQEPACIIDTIEIEEEEDRGDVLVAKGFTATRLLNRRVITQYAQLTGSAGQICAQLTDGIFSDPARGFPRFEVSFRDMGEAMDYESEPMELDEAILSLCKAGSLGIACGFSGVGRFLSIWLYEGSDRSVGTEKPVVFSPDYENVSDLRLEDSMNAYKNFVYVMGEKPTKERPYQIIETVGEETSGYARYEAVQTATKSRTVTVGEESYEMTDGEYREVLRQSGQEYLNETVRALSCEGEIVMNSRLYRYGEDYALGDIVTLRHPRYGYDEALRVTEVEDAYENGQHARHIVLGSPRPTLIDKIKLKGR